MTPRDPVVGPGPDDPNRPDSPDRPDRPHGRDNPDGPDGHVDVDVLSDLVEGLLDTAAADAAEAHVAVCADCRETRDALAEVRELLRAQPAEPMPDDVFAGIQAALAEAAREDGRSDDSRSKASVPAISPASSSAPSADFPAAASPASVVPPRPGLDLGSLPPPRLSTPPAPPQSPPVVHLASARRRRHTTGWLLAAAAVAAVVVGVGVSGGFGGKSSDDNADRSAGAPLTSSAPHDAESGAGAAPPNAAGTRAPSTAALPEYTRANVAERVDALVGKPSAATGASRNGAADAAPTLPVDVPACVSAAVPDLGTPTAAERARFEGKTAYVLVVAEPGGDSARVAIVDAACAESSRSTTGTNGAAPADPSTRSPSASEAPGEATPGNAAGPAAVLYSATVPLP